MSRSFSGFDQWVVDKEAGRTSVYPYGDPAVEPTLFPMECFRELLSERMQMEEHLVKELQSLVKLNKAEAKVVSNTHEPGREGVQRMALAALKDQQRQYTERINTLKDALKMEREDGTRTALTRDHVSEIAVFVQRSVAYYLLNSYPTSR